MCFMHLLRLNTVSNYSLAQHPFLNLSQVEPGALPEQWFLAQIHSPDCLLKALGGCCCWMPGRVRLPWTASWRFSGKGWPLASILYARIWARSWCSCAGLKGEGPLLGWFITCGSPAMMGPGWLGVIWGGVGPPPDIGLDTCSGAPSGDGCGDI